MEMFNESRDLGQHEVAPFRVEGVWFHTSSTDVSTVDDVRRPSSKIFMLIYDAEYSCMCARW